MADMDDRAGGRAALGGSARGRASSMRAIIRGALRAPHRRAAAVSAHSRSSIRRAGSSGTSAGSRSSGAGAIAPDDPEATRTPSRLAGRRRVVEFEPRAARDALDAAAARLGRHRRVSRRDARRHARRARGHARRRALLLRARALSRGHARRGAADDAADARPAAAAARSRRDVAATAAAAPRAAATSRSPAATFLLGAPPGADARRFVFDNEKWAHPVDARAVRDRAPLRDQRASSRRSSTTAATRGASSGPTRDGAGARKPARAHPGVLAARGRRAGSGAGSTLVPARPRGTRHPRQLRTKRRRTARGPAAACPPRPSGNARHALPRPPARRREPRPARARARSPAAARRRRARARLRQRLGMDGERVRALSRASRRIPTPTTRRRGSATIACCAAVPSRRARGWCTRGAQLLPARAPRHVRRLPHLRARRRDAAPPRTRTKFAEILTKINLRGPQPCHPSCSIVARQKRPSRAGKACERRRKRALPAGCRSEDVALLAVDGSCSVANGSGARTGGAGSRAGVRPFLVRIAGPRGPMRSRLPGPGAAAGVRSEGHLTCPRSRSSRAKTFRPSPTCSRSAIRCWRRPRSPGSSSS